MSTLDVLTSESETLRASEDGVDGDDADDDGMVITECAGVGGESDGEFVTSTLVQSGLPAEESNSSALLLLSPSSLSIPKASSSAALSDATV